MTVYEVYEQMTEYEWEALLLMANALTLSPKAFAFFARQYDNAYDFFEAIHRAYIKERNR